MSSVVNCECCGEPMMEMWALPVLNGTKRGVCDHCYEGHWDHQLLVKIGECDVER